MGDKTDREHRLHPVTVGEWQRRGFRALICRIRGATAAHSIRTNTRCRYDGLMFVTHGDNLRRIVLSEAVQMLSISHRIASPAHRSGPAAPVRSTATKCRRRSL